MYNLGRLYETGRGVKQDYQIAKEWYLRTAKADDAVSMLHLASILQKGLIGLADPDERKNGIAPADLGNVDAMIQLGEIYEDRNGPTHDYVRAFPLYLRASQTNTLALAKVGWMYETGNGVPRNYTEAMKCFQHRPVRRSIFHVTNRCPLSERIWN